MARITWTFDGVTFRARSSDEFDPWFSPAYEYTLDKVKGGTDTYLDLGAVGYPPLTLRAQFTSEATRTAMVAKLGTTGTLSNDSAFAPTGSATLVKTARVNNPSGQAYYLDCTFEYRP